MEFFKKSSVIYMYMYINLAKSNNKQTKIKQKQQNYCNLQIVHIVDI